MASKDASYTHAFTLIPPNSTTLSLRERYQMQKLSGNHSLSPTKAGNLGYRGGDENKARNAGGLALLNGSHIGGAVHLQTTNRQCRNASAVRTFGG